MLYPPMSELLTHINSRYLLVNVVAHRARQISIEAEEYHQPLEEKEPAEPVLTLTGQRMPLKKIMNISANALAAPSTRKKKNAA